MRTGEGWWISEESSLSITTCQLPQPCKPTASTNNTTVRKFPPAWQKTFPWLQYDEQKGLMSCSIYVKHKKNNTFTKGTNNFRFSALGWQMAHHDHADALRADAMQGEFLRAVRKALNKKEAVLVGLKAVYWVVNELLLMHKYESLMSLLAQLKCPHVGHLAHGKNVTYRSSYSKWHAGFNCHGHTEWNWQ